MLLERIPPVIAGNTHEVNYVSQITNARKLKRFAMRGKLTWNGADTTSSTFAERADA